MLSILFGKYDVLIHEHDLVQYHANYFEVLFKWSWLDEDWIRRELHTVERFPMNKSPKQELFDRDLTFKQLAGGTKLLLLIRHMPGLYDFSRLGPNCYPYLMEIADMQDVFVASHTLYAEFDDDIIRGRDIKIANSGVIVSTFNDFIDEAVKFV